MFNISKSRFLDKDAAFTYRIVSEPKQRDHVIY